MGALAPLIGAWLTFWLSFVARDVYMRYQWGMGVGHTYAHATRAGSQEDPDTAGVQDLHDFEERDESGSEAGFGVSHLGGEESDSDWGSSTSDKLEGSDIDSDEYYTLDYEN